MQEKKEFNKIIAALDGSDSSMKAAKKAINLAEKTKIEVLAIYVVNKLPFKGFIPSDKTDKYWKKEMEEEAQKTLNKVEELAKKQDVKIHTMMLKGNPEEHIIKQANKDNLIIMGSKGKNAVDRILVGSVSEKVLHHADSTVMIVR